MTPKIPAALVVLALAASGCSGTAKHAAAGPSSAASPSASSTTSPLDAYLGVGQDMTADATVLADSRKTEEAIARCMAAQGFDYVPQPLPSFSTKAGPGGSQIVTVGKPTLPDLPPDQFAARYGYGITTAPAADKTNDPIDQNLKIVEKMSVAERVAYFHTLYGTGTPLDSSGNLTSSITTSDSSCSGRADKLVPTDAEENSTQRKVDRVRTTYKTLLDRVGELNDSELSDARVQAATRAWSGCLTGAGFPGFTSLEAPRQKILTEARALLGHDLDGTPSDPARLAALRRTEIRLAVADNTCLKAWQQTFAVVRHDLEEQFVKENLSELTSYRSAMAAASR